MDPLTEPQIHRAIRALDAGDRPDGATIKTALLMALAWHAAQVEIAAYRRQYAPAPMNEPDNSIGTARASVIADARRVSIAYSEHNLFRLIDCVTELDKTVRYFDLLQAGKLEEAKKILTDGAQG
jgi:hypothetical protein